MILQAFSLPHHELLSACESAHAPESDGLLQQQLVQIRGDAETGQGFGVAVGTPLRGPDSLRGRDGRLGEPSLPVTRNVLFLNHVETGTRPGPSALGDRGPPGALHSFLSGGSGHEHRGMIDM